MPESRAKCPYSPSGNYAIYLWDKTLAIEEAKLKVKTRYVKKFRRVLPPKKLARFYQAENKMDISVNYELSDVIPLVPVSETETRSTE